MADVSASETSGRASPACTRIPRVKSQPSALAQKPPRGGGTTAIAKAPQTTRRNSSSAPNSRCSSPLPKQANTQASTGANQDKRTIPSATVRQTPGSPSSVKRLPGSPALGRRPPGSPLIKRSSPLSSPSARRKSISKAVSPSDHRPPGHPSVLAKTPRSPSKISKPSSALPKRDAKPTPDVAVGVKRVPTPIVQRKDLGAYSDIPRNRTPVVSVTNKTLDDEVSAINKCDADGAVEGNDDCDKEHFINGSNNKENKFSMASKLKARSATGPAAGPAPDPSDNKLTDDGKGHENNEQQKKSMEAFSCSSQKDQTVLKNANNNKPACDVSVDCTNRFTDTDTSTVNQNLGQDMFVIDDDCLLMTDNQTKGHYRSRSMGVMSTSLDSFNLREKIGPRYLRAGVGRSFSPVHLDLDGGSDANMNRCLTSGFRTSAGHCTPASSATAAGQCSLSRTSISLSLPVLSNGQYVHTKLTSDARLHYNNNNNNNVVAKSVLCSSALTDVIPKNAGEELSTAKLDDSSLFVPGQNGIPVILPDALELGGQGLCENCDEVKSPISPTADLVSPTGSPYENGLLYSEVDALSKKSQSCPNLLFKEPGQLTLKPEVFLDSDDIYEKYPPIRHLDVNQLEYYREEQLREYYQYLQEQHAEWIRQGLVSPDSGQDVQRISVIRQLPTLLNPENNAECMRRVVPKIREVLHVAQPDVQLAACNAFLQILQEEKVPLQNYTQTFLKSILTSIDNRDPDVANAWLDTLLDVIDLLPKDVIKKDIMSLAISKGQLSQSVQSRLACCRILGKIATKFDPFIIKKDILPIVQALCQDVDYEVRGCMCRQLDSVARGLGLEQTKSAILPELVELTNDEESYVRLAGLETVVNVLSLLDDETCTETIVPLVCKFCQQALNNEDSTLPAVAKQLGKLCHGLSVNFTEEQKHWFIDYYNKLCKYGAKESAKHKEEDEQSAPKPVIPFSAFPSDMLEEEDKSVETRKNAGFNFPAMVMFTGVRHFKSSLFSSFHSLCSDFHYSVRKTVASGFHEVAKLLANNASILIPEFISLLQDDSTEVLKGLVEHLPDTLEVIIKSINHSTSENKAEVHNDLISAILYSEGVIFASNNWRLQEELMKQLACMSKCFSSDQIFQNFMPLLFRKLLTAKALPVKLAVGRTIIVLMRHNRKLEQRDEICERLVQDLCRAHSCHRRSLFIDLCWMIIELYSRAFFKQYFFEPVLELANDNVPNVRLKLCPLLPRLKQLVKLPADRNLLQLLEQAVRKILVNETDRDVTAAIESAVAQLDDVQFGNKKGVYAEDVADQKKEEEEKQLLEFEEQDKRDEEMKSLRSERKKDSCNKKDSKIPAPKRGSKIPAATNMTKDKTQLTSSQSASERGGSFTSGSSTHNHSAKAKRTGSKEDLVSTTRRAGPSSAGPRKSSASGVSASANSTGQFKGRRASIPNSTLPTDMKKSSGPARKLSVGSITANGSSPSSKKK